MDGYAAYGRVDRRRVAGATCPTRDDWLPPDLGAIEATDRAAEGPSAGRWLHERLAAVREQWTMSTFYLFDSNSWR